MPTLVIDELSCGYGHRAVLEALCLEVRAGEVFVLLGPNGAGKTTLLRALSRQLRPQHGTICLDAENIWRLSPEELSRSVSLMPQAERRDWPLTVQQAVQLGRAPHRGWCLPLTAADHAIVERALQQTGLSDLKERSITELSGGEWRRAILARALAQQSQVLLLDEPIAGLDLRYQIEVLRLIRKLAHAEQLTVILTLHDLNLAAVYGDRLALLADHRLTALGTPSEVLTADRIGEAYGIAVTVLQHPVYEAPLIAPLLEVPAR